MSHLPAPRTRHNLESALAGESMAHIKYRYFARLCRAQGDEATARLFEATADQEIQHAWGHLDLLLADDTLTPQRCLQLAIAGETYEYTEMYPKFRAEAELEGDAAAGAEIEAQIHESREHAGGFSERLSATQLDKARKRFDALARVEERHANHYRARLAERAA